MKDTSRVHPKHLFAAIACVIAVVVAAYLMVNRVKQTDSAPAITSATKAEEVNYDVVAIDRQLPGAYDGTPRTEQPDFSPSSDIAAIPAQATDQQIAASRLFGSRLVAIGDSAPDAATANRAIAELLRELQQLDDELTQTPDPGSDPHAFEKAYRKEKFNRIADWLQAHPDSRWAPTLRHELANYQYDRGYLDQARDNWQQNWSQLKDADRGSGGYAVANEALGRLLDLNRGYARNDQLRELVNDAQGRYLGAALKGRLFQANRALWLLEHRGAENVMCGPLALNAVNHSLGKPIKPPLLGKVSQEYIGIGLPLTQVERYAQENYQLTTRMARRDDRSTPIPTPAVVHDKDEHYFAVLEASASGDEYFIEDQVRRYAGWVDREALEQRSSGYFLLADSDLPTGWSTVEVAEGNRVFGRDGDHKTDECTTRCCPTGDCSGMPRYTIHRLPAVLRLGDVPLGYQPPVGRGIQFFLNYLDIDSGAPVTAPNFSNVGISWSIDWVAWIDHQPGALGANSIIEAHIPGGGVLRHRFNAAGQPIRDPASGAVLTRSGGHTYTRTGLDGSKEIYSTGDAASAPDRVFLTRSVDPYGNEVSYSYDNQMRLVTVTDAIGQVTTLHHDHPSDPFLITSVVDPFNRSALLDYDATGQLVAVTDQIGLTSSFAYDAGDGGIASMTTPYGTTSFETSGYSNSNPFGGTSWTQVKVTDPQGDVEQVEYVDRSFRDVDAINDPPATVTVAGEEIPFVSNPASLGSRSTFVWDKEAWHTAPGDYSAATMLQWATDENWLVVAVLQARRAPGEDVVWYNYPGSAEDSNLNTSLGVQPTKILRMASDGTPILQQYEYNNQGQLSKATDPLGRSSEYTYSNGGLTLASARVTTGGIDETIASYTYNAQLSPLSVTDAAGQTTSVTYNARGQVETVTNALGHSTTLGYDTDGYLQTQNGPLPGDNDLTSYGYDPQGRTNSVTSPGGHHLSVVYDDFDRITRIDYPDGTFAANTYDRLSHKTATDRLGRTTSYDHNALGQVVTVTDPLGRITGLEWCRCGDIRKLTDAMGRITEWQRDSQGRPVRKIYPDLSEQSWSYDPSLGHLTSSTGRNGQSTTYDYTHDGHLAAIGYPTIPGVPATAGVSFSYDPVYGRQSSMSDALGTTTYSYHPVGSLGAGALASVDGPWDNDTVSYAYDTLGRTSAHQIGGASFGHAPVYDPGGRLTAISNALGTFQHTYDDDSHLGLTQVEYPNGIKANYSYQYTGNGFRLAAIHNTSSGNASNTLSRFAYDYDAAGQITQWTRDLPGHGGNSRYDYSYDAAGQLLGAVLKKGGALLVADEVFGYDPAGNRTSKQTATENSVSEYNDLNQLTLTSGDTYLEGQVDELSRVSVAGQAVPVTSDGNGNGNGNDHGNRFSALLDLDPGTYQIPVEATDRSGNTSSETYEITVPVPQPPVYDAAGNLVRQMIDGKARSYEWDAANRLLAIQSDETPEAGDWRSEFDYDGLSRRVRQTEYTHDGSDWVEDESVTYLWCGTQICQKRDATGANTTEHYLPQGFIRNGRKYFTTRDHLGSVREVVSAEQSSVYDYTPWGEVITLEESTPAAKSTFRYTGHFYHERSKLHLTLYRAYDPAAGRWLSQDPLGEAGGINLYGYVGNGPTNGWDPLGFCAPRLAWWAGSWAGRRLGAGIVGTALAWTVGEFSGANDIIRDAAVDITEAAVAANQARVQARAVAREAAKTKRPPPPIPVFSYRPFPQSTLPPGSWCTTDRLSYDEAIGISFMEDIGGRPIFEHTALAPAGSLVPMGSVHGHPQFQTTTPLPAVAIPITPP